MPEIHIKIRHGKATVEAEGFEGPNCVEITRPLREAMGRTVSDDPKPEFEMRDIRNVGQ